MMREQVFQMCGVRQINGLRVRLVAPDARELDDTQPLIVWMNHRLELVKVPVCMFRPYAAAPLVQQTDDWAGDDPPDDLPGMTHEESMARRAQASAELLSVARRARASAELLSIIDACFRSEDPDQVDPIDGEMMFTVPLIMRPKLDVLTIETPDGWLVELIDGADIDERTQTLSWAGKTW